MHERAFQWFGINFTSFLINYELYLESYIHSNVRSFSELWMELDFTIGILTIKKMYFNTSIFSEKSISSSSSCMKQIYQLNNDETSVLASHWQQTGPKSTAFRVVDCESVLEPRSSVMEIAWVCDLLRRAASEDYLHYLALSRTIQRSHPEIRSRRRSSLFLAVKRSRAATGRPITRSFGPIARARFAQISSSARSSARIDF